MIELSLTNSSPYKFLKRTDFLHPKSPLTIGGWQKTSLLEYPGKVATVLFTSGCNFRCSFCHNPDLVHTNRNHILLHEEQFMDFLKRRNTLYQAVVISGGEPTLHGSLPAFLERIKQMDLLVGLETNGTNTDMLAELLDRRAVDYVAMDVKTVLDIEKYAAVTGTKDRSSFHELFYNVRKSVDLLLNSSIETEFRTTVIPAYHTEETISEIARSLHGAHKYVLQRIVRGVPILGTIPGESFITVDQLRDIKAKIQHHFHCCTLRD